MPRRLLIVLPSVERGGAEEYSLTLARVAISSGWEVHAAFCQRTSLRDLAKEFLAAGAQYHPLDISDVNVLKTEHFKTSFAHIWPMTKTLLKVRPDAVALMLCGIEYALGAQIACALYRTAAGLVFHLVPPGRLLRENVRRARKSLAGQHTYITVSDHNRYALAESLKVPVTNIRVVPNGVDFDSYAGGADRSLARQALLRELNLPDNSTIALTVGRICHQKGYDLLVAAAKEVVARHPNLRFVWAGDGPDAQTFTELIAKDGLQDHFALLGRRRDVPALLAAADLFVLPARFEGQPLSLLEAMAAGTPVVVSRVSGITEIVDDKIHGLLCAPDDSKSLESAILQAVEDPALMIECARQARTRAQYFDANASCALVLECIANRESPESTPDAAPTENAEFLAVLMELIATLPSAKDIETMAQDANEKFESGPLSQLGGFALIASYLTTDQVSPYLARLHASAKLKLARSNSDEGAWALAVVLALRHGVQDFTTLLKDPRNLHHVTNHAIELAPQIDSAECRAYLEWLGHNHPDPTTQRLAIMATLPSAQDLDAMAQDANEKFESGPLSRLGEFATIATNLTTDQVSPYLARLHAGVQLKLARSNADEGAWAVAVVLALRHGVQDFTTLLKDPRNFDHVTASMVELASRLDSIEGREYLEWISHAHSDVTIRRLAKNVLLRGLTGLHRAREWLRLTRPRA